MTSPIVEGVATRTNTALSTLSRAERRVGRALLADYPSAGLGSAAPGWRCGSSNDGASC